jgi:tungstate transport system substrate-binding protein
MRICALAVVIASLLALAVGMAACGSNDHGPTADELIIATTTSVKDSGLMDDALLPAFAKLHPDLSVKVIAVGSGEALAMGSRGEADALLVHSPKDESAFMTAGHGTLRLPVAYNYYVIVGPRDDPAKVWEAGSAADGFSAIAKANAHFVSRSDQSGTNRKELSIWNSAGVTTDPAASPEEGWYLKSGQGMGETLQIASEEQAYTLTDMATYLSMRDSLDLAPLSTTSDDLKNSYSVIVVDQNEFDRVNSAAAEQFAAFLVSKQGQDLVAAFGKDEYGQALFFPNAGSLGSE